MDKFIECLSCGIRCDRSVQGCFNIALKQKNQCNKCLALLLEEHDAKVRQKVLEELSINE